MTQHRWTSLFEGLLRAGPGVQLAFIGFALASLILVLQSLTLTRSLKNQEQALILQFKEVLPEIAFDNNPLREGINYPDEMGLIDIRLFEARKAGQPVAQLILATTPEGYSGNIRILVGLDEKARITGVRILENLETPGFGDRIAWPKSPWLSQFSGLVRETMQAKDWNFRNQGGRFDQVTGATVTPRAVIRAVRHVLDVTQNSRP